MRYVVTKAVTIDSAHRLDSLSDDHPCFHLHGHTYRIEVTLSASTIDEHGMVLDFNLISGCVKQFDHRYLNDFFKPTTAEVFAQQLWDLLEMQVLKSINENTQPKDQIRMECVQINETENNKCRYVREK